MKRVTVLAGCLLVVLGASALPAAAQQPIKVGVLYGLGGAAAPYTKPAVTGHEMAVDEINAAGGLLGRKVQLVIRDDQSKPDVGVREARDLILKEKVDFLTGIIHSGVALAVSEVAKEHKTIPARLDREDGRAHRGQMAPLRVPRDVEHAHRGARSGHHARPAAVQAVRDRRTRL